MNITNPPPDQNQPKRGKKKSNRDRQSSAYDDKSSASVMSNLSSYSLIDDDHIDDQETINVGNLIIDLESDLEKEKIENEQAIHNVNLENSAKSNTKSTTDIAPSSTSHHAATSSSATINKNNSSYKSLTNHHLDETKPTGKQNQKSASRKDSSYMNSSQNAGTNNNNGHNVTARTVFKTSADERGELKMKITREMKPGKNEHKIVTSPNQKSPTSSSGSATSGNNPHTAGQINNYVDTNEFMPKLAQSTSSISSTKECGTSTSIGTITEPDCLGPCEPGTSVTLEGIVWQETDGGILVVNVTWRGKTYVGALLDCTRHDWAPPRLCDSPASDIDAKTSKGVRGKRIVTRSNGIGLDEKNLLQTTGKLRNGKGRRIPTSSDQATCSKKQRETTDRSSSETLSAQPEINTPQTEMSTNSETTCVQMSNDTSNANNNNNNNQPESLQQQESDNMSLDKAGPNSPMLIGCSEPNCSKKYRNMNGLLYHQSHAHSAENESSSNQDDSSTKDKDSKDADEDLNLIDRVASPTDSQNARTTAERQEEQPYSQTHYQGQKRERTPSPEMSMKMSNRFSNDGMHHNQPEHRPRLNDSPRITAVRNVDSDRRPSSGHGNVSRNSDTGRKSPNYRSHSHETPSLGLTSSINVHQINPNTTPSKPSQPPKQPNPQPPLSAPTEEGMKPSGTSTGPPPAPHQANCYFNPAFMANTFNPYGMPPYFPRHMYDQITPPAIPTSNAAFLTRFMNNMRVPPPPDSPSRLLSPSMPKNIPFPPFKVEPGAMPPAPQIPTSHPLSNISPMTNPPMPPLPVPPIPPLSLPGGPPNLRMPNPGDPMMPQTSQPPFLPPPPGLNPALAGIPGMGNPLGPLGGPQVPSLVDDSHNKQFPRRFN